jgi:hypothetical protein
MTAPRRPAPPLSPSGPAAPERISIRLNEIAAQDSLFSAISLPAIGSDRLEIALAARAKAA